MKIQIEIQWPCKHEWHTLSGPLNCIGQATEVCDICGTMREHIAFSFPPNKGNPNPKYYNAYPQWCDLAMKAKKKALQK